MDSPPKIDTGLTASAPRIPVRPPHAYALGFCLLTLFLFSRPLLALARLSFQDELASHLLIVPLISGILLYLERAQLFRPPYHSPVIGLSLLAATFGLWALFESSLQALSPNDRLSAMAVMIAAVWVAGFILVYGIASFRAAVFPLLFLFLMTPLPGALAQHLNSFLQQGSAEACYSLFHVIGVPVVRDGFRFGLPGVEIEVAQQCSGIHSGISLLIAGLLAQHFLLNSNWKKAFFVLCILPIAMLKNAIRIVVIAWLGIHVNPHFFYGSLHRQGGLPFSLIALAMMAALLWILRHASKSAPESTDGERVEGAPIPVPGTL